MNLDKKDPLKLEFTWDEWFKISKDRRRLIDILNREGRIKLTIHEGKKYDFKH